MKKTLKQVAEDTAKPAPTYWDLTQKNDPVRVLSNSPSKLHTLSNSDRAEDNVAFTSESEIVRIATHSIEP
ncbi:MAG: hypothetical protein SWY16_14335 [Cyanobacteriota bacterium]|nr:hypothetical protein [Cyanobacteriota bacterium]